jgi:DNA-binding NarL/FixJ family response regulator
MAAHYSGRESEILSLVARGLTDKEIAQELGISKNTVATHMYRILTRRGTRSRAAAVADWLGGGSILSSPTTALRSVPRTTLLR